ncbi:complex I NDUFA9 subunit family protein [Novosphingobium sp. PC22D]|uniref:complex I NDUFA9 subunit family protein n=1 Tax=Novosphingobium sp. PC22D TaxID=1962403 RepID=UPI000BF017E9|nr:complex I NDUFA9 subunit family protein [Novosphingobium sp. PC22D]PEQ13552.1 complex I NDUFA9 subunit family protein [Novosphingobium sp. PC22D]
MIESATPNLTGKIVTVLGGSGFVGRHLAQELLARGARVRIASRNPEKAYKIKPLGNLGQVATARVDVTRPETLARVLAGSDAVVYLVGAFSGNLDALQGKGVGQVAAVAREAGVASFVHISAIGCDAGSPVAYARTKAEGEDAVFAAFPEATVLRPSLLFGPDDNFVMMFAKLIAAFPALPVFAPEAKLQPLFVDDAAEAIASAIATDSAKGKIFEIAGPEVITMIEFNRRIAEAQCRHRALIELPGSVSRAIAAATGWLPGAPITSDQLALLEAGSVASGKLPGLADLGVRPRPLELFLDRWMVPFRKHGRFADTSTAR